MTREPFRPSSTLVRALAGSPICVGTQNPAKLEAVRSAFASFQSPDCVLDLVPVEVSSGVPEQPIGFENPEGLAGLLAEVEQLLVPMLVSASQEDEV